MRSVPYEIALLVWLKCAHATQVIPAPIVVPPSQFFEGIDGSWSTFNIRVGTPAQSVRVIASTNSPDTLVVRPQGCSVGAIPNGVPSDCVTARGGTYNSNLSSTWLDEGWFSLNGGSYGYEANLGYQFNLDYGMEKLGLGFQESDAPTLENQTISTYNLPNPLYLGLLGLGTQPIIYTTYGNYSAPSYFTTLRNHSLIPSLSWSYTAGANYRLSAGQYAQLIFGGYDTSRYQPNDLTIPISADVTRDLVVGIQSIFYIGSTTIPMLPTPVYAFIESTDPNIWLPLEACRLFESAFGITYDENTEKYLMNNTLYTTLTALNPSVTFRLATSTNGGTTVDISLPFSAFGLKADYPFVANSSYYFPLKRAANSTQYTLGRTFLQEAYLTVDYDRGNFSISQCTWAPGVASKIVSIVAPSDSKSSSSSSSSSSETANNKSESTGSSSSSIGPAIGGAVGGIAVLALIAGVVFYFWRRSKRAKPVELPLTSAHKHTTSTSKPPHPGLEDETESFYKESPLPHFAAPYERTPSELVGSEQQMSEMAAEREIREMSPDHEIRRYELAAPFAEMDGDSTVGSRSAFSTPQMEKARLMPANTPGNLSDQPTLNSPELGSPWTPGVGDRLMAEGLRNQKVQPLFHADNNDDEPRDRTHRYQFSASSLGSTVDGSWGENTLDSTTSARVQVVQGRQAVQLVDSGADASRTLSNPRRPDGAMTATITAWEDGGWDRDRNWDRDRDRRL